MKRILFCISVFLIFFSAGKDLPAAEEKSERNFWRYDFRSARKYAKEEGKLLLLFFTISDSPAPMNKQMILLYRTNRFFLEKSAEDYVLLHIDLPNDPEKLTAGRKRQNSLLRNRFSVTAFPAFVLADPGNPWGTLLYKRQGRIAPGDLLDILNKRFAARIKKMRQKRENEPSGNGKNGSEKGKIK